MDCYNFSFIIGEPKDEEKFVDKLYESGCDEALYCVVFGVPQIEFDCYSDSLEEAIINCLNKVRKIGGSVHYIIT